MRNYRNLFQQIAKPHQQYWYYLCFFFFCAFFFIFTKREKSIEKYFQRFKGRNEKEKLVQKERFALLQKENIFFQ